MRENGQPIQLEAAGRSSSTPSPNLPSRIVAFSVRAFIGSSTACEFAVPSAESANSSCRKPADGCCQSYYRSFAFISRIASRACSQGSAPTWDGPAPASRLDDRNLKSLPSHGCLLFHDGFVLALTASRCRRQILGIGAVMMVRIPKSAPKPFCSEDSIFWRRMRPDFSLLQRTRRLLDDFSFSSVISSAPPHYLCLRHLGHRKTGSNIMSLCGFHQVLADDGSREIGGFPSLAAIAGQNPHHLVLFAHFSAAARIQAVGRSSRKTRFPQLLLGMPIKFATRIVQFILVVPEMGGDVQHLKRFAVPEAYRKGSGLLVPTVA